MSGKVLFFTDVPVDDIAEFIGEDSMVFEYKKMVFSCPGLDEIIIPGMNQYGLEQGHDEKTIFDLSKEYLRKIGETFFVVEILQGYRYPSITMMPEVVLDLKDSVSGEWPRSLLETLPEVSIEKDFVFEKDVDILTYETPTKKHPYFEYYTKYRIVDSGIM